MWTPLEPTSRVLIIEMSIFFQGLELNDGKLNLKCLCNMLNQGMLHFRTGCEQDRTIDRAQRSAPL